MKKAKTGFLLTAGLAGLLSVSGLAAAASNSFSDVSSANPYASYIQDLHDQGVVEGTSDGKFNPTGSITRAEFVQLLMTAMKIPVKETSAHFTDLSHNSAAAYVETAWSDGWVYGTSAHTFSPDAPIKREEAAVIVWRYLKAEGVTPSTQTFMLPNTVDAWAREGVAQSMTHQLWGVPFSSGTYQSPVSREEAAALIDTAHKLAAPKPLLTVTREDPLNQFDHKTYSTTISNQEEVTKLLSLLKNLPEFPSGTVHCPMDSGVAYQLDFQDAKLKATVEASGCQKVTINNKAYWGVDQNSNGFMSYLMKVLGMDRQQFTGIQG